MSQQSKDQATMELLVTALFDGGHYHFDPLLPMGPAGLSWSAPSPDGPRCRTGWIAVLPMNVRPGQAQVSDGWRWVGLVTVEAARAGASTARCGGGMPQLGSLMLAGSGCWRAMGVSALLRCALAAGRNGGAGRGDRRWPFRVGRAGAVELQIWRGVPNHMSERHAPLPSRRRDCPVATKAAATSALVYSTGLCFGGERRVRCRRRRPSDGLFLACQVDCRSGHAQPAAWAGAHLTNYGGGRGPAGQFDGVEGRIAGARGGAEFAILCRGFTRMAGWSWNGRGAPWRPPICSWTGRGPADERGGGDLPSR